MSLKSYISMYLKGFDRLRINMSVLKNGQVNNYAILQTAHRLEKGLCMRNPRGLWGFDKAELLIDLLAAECSLEKPDIQTVKIGASVLSAYITSKVSTNNKEEIARANMIHKKAEQKDILKYAEIEYGGAITLNQSDILLDSEYSERLFLTRHSVRDFAETPVDMKKLERAVGLALQAPSACNRQASQIYVISGDDRKKAGSSNEYHADKYLIITGNMRAFTVSELNDWIVSTSIFCGYLSLALHAEGIASCIFRKDTIRESNYNKAIRKLCNIPADEQIILEMAIGNYKEKITVPVSSRRNPNDIIHIR